ncbi:hypothetical protein HYDPIDRAFT_106240 [Hydnomerulius pinastri MD-312]|nr:hypothetical protein HYDPIDRAFT_106240 [Hydnomerulius pinastri MD-312]
MPAMLGMPLTLTLGAITVGLLIFIKLVKPRRETRGFSLPGPVSLPFVGSALSIRPSEPWVTYKEWGARYGDIFQMRIFSQNTIVINSEKIAKALLDQRSGIYSDRPYLATREPYGWSFHFAWEHYGERWRNRRRLFHQVFRAEAALEQRPLQLRKARQLVLDLLNAPSSYPLHIERFSTGIIMAIVYGYEIQPHNDPFVELFERGVSTAMEGLTLEMASVVATFPFVLSLPAWFPGAYIRRRADLAKQFAKEMLSEPVEYASKCVVIGYSWTFTVWPKTILKQGEGRWDRTIRNGARSLARRKRRRFPLAPAVDRGSSCSSIRGRVRNFHNGTAKLLTCYAAAPRGAGTRSS